jgi:recombination protein RecR
MKYIEPIARLVEQFTKLPGVGKKTASRYAYSIIAMDVDEVDAFAAAMKQIKRKVRYCSVCGNFTDLDVCEICSSRDRSVICVVKEPRDVVAFEKIQDYKGVYHVLHGQLSPLNGIGPDDLHIKELLARLEGVNEVIIATNPDVEGDATALYLSRLIKPLGITVTRIARGLPSGSEIEYADEVTLSRALHERKPI